MIFLAPDVLRLFPPEVALLLVRYACEMPDKLGRSISVWTCGHLAQPLVDENIVPSLSAETVRRILQSHKLRPWRVHHWMNPLPARDEVFYERPRRIADLYMRPLAPHEMVWSLDEKTSLQPRPRRAKTRRARPCRTVQGEHEHKRDGALHLFAAFDTRWGRVVGRTYERKRQDEMLDFLEALNRHIPAKKTKVCLIMDNVSYHKGTLVRAWLQKHPRFDFYSLQCTAPG